MRIFGYLGIGFLIVWLFAPAPIAMADTALVVAPDTTQSPPQPTPGELDLLNLLDQRPQSSSASRFTAGAFGFLTLIQCGDRPETMPQ
jgi:hypothetical protein